MVSRKTYAAAAVALVLAAGCSDPLDIGNFAVDGEWRGSFKQLVGADSVRYDFRFELHQDRRDVSGTAVVTSGTDSVETDVSGNWDYPAVRMRLSAPDYAPLDFAASFVTRDTLRGPVTGSGFTTKQLTIIRQ